MRLCHFLDLPPAKRMFFSVLLSSMEEQEQQDLIIESLSLLVVEHRSERCLLIAIGWLSMLLLFSFFNAEKRHDTNKTLGKRVVWHLSDKEIIARTDSKDIRSADDKVRERAMC